MIANTRRSGFPLLVLLSLFFALLISGCGKSGSAGGGKDINDPGHPRTSTLNVLVPDPAGTTVYGNDFAAVDASNTSEGYVMVQYKGTSTKVKLQITTPDATVYSYSLSVGDYATFPLSGGSGSYHLDVLENAYDDLYAIVFSQDMDVTISDEFKPFLYPNQYVWFTPDSKAVAKTGELSDQSSSDLGYVQSVYEYVIKNISYDTKKAEDIPTNYIPDIDETLSSGKGICFDYASLMSAMLRCQGIPTRLEVGYSGEAYHAWISVYLKESGWVDNIIEFDGSSWSLMDPTLGANNKSSSVKKYIGDGSNYTVKYTY